MDEKGVFAIARSIWECDDFLNQKFTQREAWMWLIGAAVWKQARINFDGKWVTLERGEFAFSVRFLAKKWGWAKSTVSRFLVTLENRSLIRDVSRDNVSVFSINKYNDFQVVGLPRGTEDGTPSGTAVGQQWDKEEAFKHDKSSSLRSEDTPPPKHKPSKPDPETAPDWLDREAWAAFLEMRRKKHKPMTPRAQKIIWGKLEAWRAKGHDPTHILDRSTENAWTTLYEPKDPENVTRINEKRPTTDQHLSGILDLGRDLRAGAYRRGS